MNETLDRVLPSNLEAERSVLGAVLLHNDAIHLAIEIIQGRDFFRDAHRRIFDSMVALSQRNETIDLVTLKEALSRSGDLENVGGPAYISALIDGVPRSSNIEHYAKIIKDKSVLRNLIFSANKTTALAYEASEVPATIIDQSLSGLLALSSDATGPGLRVAGDLVNATLDELEELSKPDSRAWGHRSGLQPLDRMLRGFRPGKLILIAARPGGGKTSLALNIARAVAKGGHGVAVFSLEMSESEVMLWLVSSEARINIEDLADEKLTQDDWRRVGEALEVFRTIPLYIDHSTDLSPISLRAKARRMQIEHGLSMVVIDYVQLMQGLPTQKRNESEHEKLTGISRAMKLLAKDLGVPIVLLSQLNRAPESRNDGRPGLSDLRGSGSLEQDADAVVIVHDPSKFVRKKKSMKTADVVREEIEKGVFELIVAKHRGGKTGIARLLFRAEYVTFENLSL